MSSKDLNMVLTFKDDSFITLERSKVARLEDFCNDVQAEERDERGRVIYPGTPVLLVNVRP